MSRHALYDMSLDDDELGGEAQGETLETGIDIGHYSDASELDEHDFEPFHPIESPRPLLTSVISPVHKLPLPDMPYIPPKLPTPTGGRHHIVSLLISYSAAD